MLAWVTLFDRFPVQKALARAAAKAEKAAAALASAGKVEGAVEDAPKVPHIPLMHQNTSVVHQNTSFMHYNTSVPLCRKRSPGLLRRPRKPRPRSRLPGRSRAPWRTPRRCHIFP